MSNALWDDMKNQLNYMTKNYSAKRRSDINDMIYKQAQKIMQIKSLSLIYDQYGNQLFEKTSTVQNYIQCKKNRFGLSLWQDDSKLIPVKQLNERFNTDFISYSSLENIELQDVKHNMLTGFEEKNEYLYKAQNQKVIKEKVFNDGINELKLWFNTKGRNDLNKKSNNLEEVTILK